MRDSFTLEELRRLLMAEVLRADTSFVRSQLLAREAMARTLAPGHEYIETHALEISELTLALAVRLDRPAWPVRLWRRIRALSGGARDTAPARYRLAPPRQGSLQLQCTVRRAAAGGHHVDVSESSHAAGPA